MVQSLLSQFQNFKRQMMNKKSDLTQQLSLKEQLQEAEIKIQLLEKMMINQSRLAIMGEMIGMIAHQWRQPITIIGMVTNNTILDIQLGESTQQQLLDDMGLIDKQVHYLSRTIDDFRNFFRQNKLPQSVTMRDISNELLTIFGKTFDNNHITLTFEGEIELEFTTYKNELLQVFLNLLSNSKDALELKVIENPYICITVTTSANFIIFEIQDNAGGIPDEIIGHIFKPYFTTKSEKDGTGLGLYMSSIIIEKHLFGTIAATNQDQGTKFTITLPMNQDPKRTHVY
jgi:signal transduction histidine kinase